MKEWLKGKKTYILLLIALIAVWLDVWLGLGLSTECQNLAEGEECSLSVSDGLKYTWGLATGGAVKGAFDKYFK